MLDEKLAQVGTTLVFSDGDYSIWWNNSATWNVWLRGTEIDCFTVYGVDNVSDATALADEWMRTSDWAGDFDA